MRQPKSLRLTWEQCEAREFHAWDGKLQKTAAGHEQHCRTCGTGAVETVRRRKAAADARRLARKEALIGV